MSTLGAPSPISNHLAHALAHTPPLHYSSNSYNHMNPLPPVQHFQTQPHHGTKRSAPDDEIESSANISTQFKKLRLGQSRLPHPTTVSPVGVSLRSNGSAVSQDPSQNRHAYADEIAMRNGNDIHTDQNTTRPPITPDLMPIDDTPSRVYIHDLDLEIAAIEAEEPKRSSFLLPDFDKNVSRIPHNVLRQNFDGMANNNNSVRDDSQALILYRDPTSISVPPEEDAARRAMIEARREAREKMKREYEAMYQSQESESSEQNAEIASGITGVLHTTHEVPSRDNESINVCDPDAMDLE